MTAASLDPSISNLLSVDLVEGGGCVRLSVTGEVDSASAPALRDELAAALDGSPAELVIDLDGVTFLDSAGLSVLAAAHRRAAAESIAMRLLASGRAVIRPMQITGLWQLLGAEQVEPGTGRTA